MECESVWVSYPLKQGLKLRSRETKTAFLAPSLSQLSIKTRIETRSVSGKPRKKRRLSQLSIKTRIETHRWECRDIYNLVWVSYPLKQGLKLNWKTVFALSTPRLSQLSIKTRIETVFRRNLHRGTAGLSQLSIKTRIETQPRTLPTDEQRAFESAIH